MTYSPAPDQPPLAGPPLTPPVGPPPSGYSGDVPGYPDDPALGPPPGPPITPTPAGIDDHGRVKRGRVSAVWTGAILAALVGIALIIFVAQNSRQVTVHFLGWHGHISLALALLIAAVGSVLLVAIPGTLRILQLRRALRKNVADR